MPVIEHYSKEGKVATVCTFSVSDHSSPRFICDLLGQIDATATIDVVHEKAKEIVGKIFAGEIGRNITA